MSIWRILTRPVYPLQSQILRRGEGSSLGHWELWGSANDFGILVFKIIRLERQQLLVDSTYQSDLFQDFDAKYLKYIQLNYAVPMMTKSLSMQSSILFRTVRSFLSLSS